MFSILAEYDGKSRFIFIFKFINWSRTQNRQIVRACNPPNILTIIFRIKRALRFQHLETHLIRGSTPNIHPLNNARSAY